MGENQQKSHWHWYWLQDNDNRFLCRDDCYCVPDFCCWKQVCCWERKLQVLVCRSRGLMEDLEKIDNYCPGAEIKRDFLDCPNKNWMVQNKTLMKESQQKIIINPFMTLTSLTHFNPFWFPYISLFFPKLTLSWW